MKNKIRILHIDDNLHDRQLVKDVLEKEHDEFEVLEADNRKKFEQYLSENNFDMVLSDFNILGFDGLQVLQLVKEKNPGTPVIIVTGTGSEEIAVQAMKLGADDYVIKSLKHIQNLIPTIKRVLENKKIQDDYKTTLVALRESEERFRLLFDTSQDGVLLTVPNGDILQANAAACIIFGRTEDELKQFGRKCVIDETDPRLPLALEERLLTGRFKGELTGLRKDGTPFPIEISSALFQDSEGNTRTSMIIRDIYERKKAEVLLKQREAQYRLLSDHMTDTVWLMDLNLKTIFISPSVEKIRGYTLEELQKLTLKQHLTNDSFNLVMEVFSEEMPKVKADPTYSFSRALEIEFYRKDRTAYWSECTFSLIRDEKGNPLSILGEGRDITERKKTEILLQKKNQEIKDQNEELLQINEKLQQAKEKAEESDRLKTAFLQNVSHEIRTPMNGILGFAQLLKDPELSYEKQKEFIGIIEQSGKRMLDIINNIIDISKIETGQIFISFKEINVNNLLNELYVFFKPEAEGKGLKLNCFTEISDELCSIETDGTRLTQILSNLLKNAIKFTKTGTINFGYFIKNNMLEFYVQDSGKGIPKSQEEIIFERFIQGDMSITREYEGAGLGLSISKAYVEKLGGKIWVESELGKGSTFSFNIPYKLPCISQSKVPIKTKLDNINQPINILIVDDDEFCLLFLKEILEREKTNLFLAKDGQEALDMVKNFPEIQIVLMDLKMPVMDGFEATTLIKKIKPGLPVIAQSAYTFSKDIDKAKIAGCDEFIRKPINRELLLSVINKQLSML